MAKKTPNTKAPSADGGFVTPEQLDAKLGSFKNDILDAIGGIVKGGDVPKQVPAPAVPGSKAAEDGGADSNSFMPKNYQALMDKVFDPADGFEGRLTFPGSDEQGRETGGLTFTIVVPKKFSNVDNAYSLMYKHDLRTKALNPGAIASGITEWCERVARNLKYQKPKGR